MQFLADGKLEEVTNHMFKELDVNKDGKVSKAELWLFFEIKVSK